MIEIPIWLFVIETCLAIFGIVFLIAVFQGIRSATKERTIKNRKVRR